MSCFDIISERLTDKFVNIMYENMWQFINLDTLEEILKMNGCDVGISTKKNVNDEKFSKKYRKTICFKGSPEEGHYVYVSHNGKVLGTYECGLISENDDGICHGAALAAAFIECGKLSSAFYSNPKTKEEMDENYKTILNTYIFIIENGTWDRALYKYFYTDVTWTHDEKTTKQTIIALKTLRQYLD